MDVKTKSTHDGHAGVRDKQNHDRLTSWSHLFIRLGLTENNLHNKSREKLMNVFTQSADCIICNETDCMICDKSHNYFQTPCVFSENLLDIINSAEEIKVISIRSNSIVWKEKWFTSLGLDCIVRSETLIIESLVYSPIIIIIALYSNVEGQ